jgi:hypothetical protein
VTLEVDVTVEPEVGKAVVDLTDNPDCVPCGLDLSEACARSTARLNVFESIDPSVPHPEASDEPTAGRIRTRARVAAGPATGPGRRSAMSTKATKISPIAPRAGSSPARDRLGLLRR